MTTTTVPLDRRLVLEDRAREAAARIARAGRPSDAQAILSRFFDWLYVEQQAPGLRVNAEIRRLIKQSQEFAEGYWQEHVGSGRTGK